MTEQLQETFPVTIYRNIADYSDEALLNRYANYLESKEFITSELGHIEQEMLRRMTERKATAISSNMYDCLLEVKDMFSQPAFSPLKEIFQEADLVKCFTPAHEETVQIPDKWLTQQVKAAARRYGAEALDIVARARIPGAPRLRFQRKEGT